MNSVPLERILDKVDALFAKNNYMEAGRVLEYWQSEARALNDRQGELAIENELVGYYRKQNNREKGLASVTRALALVEELSQGDMASGATILLNCATAYKAFARPEAALPLYRQAEKTYKNTLSPDDPRFGGLYNNMAITLADLGKYTEAEAAYHSALSVMEKAPRGEAECAITWINLAYLYEKAGRRSEISNCMLRAFLLLQSDKLPRDGHYAFVLEKCAPAFRDFGDAAACEQLLKESEEIYARS